MKIGFMIGNMSNTGGTERVLQRIANGLSGRGYQIVVISMWGDKNPVFKLDKRIKRYRLAENYPKGIRANIKNIFLLYQIVKKEKITVLIDVDLILAFYSLPVKVFTPKLHRISWEHFNYYYQFRKNNKIRRLAMRLSARFSEVLLVISKEDEMYYRKNLNIKGMLSQIYNPNTYEQVSCNKIPEKMVFAAGRLTRAKGFDYLLKSWEIIENDFPDWKLCIAGEGEDKELLLDIIHKKELKSVELLGLVKDIQQYYEKCAFFVLPSRNEGFGMVLIEAMAYGKPVVSFACKAGPSDIVNDGKNGFLVPTGNYKQFALKMRYLMETEELRKKMGKNAKESTKRFDTESILDQWEELLKILT